MSKFEKEYRYKITRETLNKIKEVSIVVEHDMQQIDLTLGFNGFDSLRDYGYICRVREKGNKTWMEIKNKRDKSSFYETEIIITKFSDGVDFFKAIGMKPYLYMNRKREILSYKGLKIFIDQIELLGDYVEVEVQNLENYEELLDEFLKLVNITSEPQPLYGDIFKGILEKDIGFVEVFEKSLSEFLSKS